MKKIIVSTLALFLTLPVFGGNGYLGPTEQINWPADSIINTLENCGFAQNEKSILTGKLMSFVKSNQSLQFSITDFITVCLDTFNTLYKENYNKNKNMYGKKCSDLTYLLTSEYNNNIQQQLASTKCTFDLKSEDLNNIETKARAKATSIMNQGADSVAADNIYKKEQILQVGYMVQKYCGPNIKAEFGNDPITKKPTITCFNCVSK